MLRVSNLSKKYKQTTALSDISIDFKKGKVYGVLGANGAGKTTLFKAITGLLPTYEGEILWNGQPIRGKEGPRIGFMIEEPCFFPGLTGKENLELFARLFDGFEEKTINDAIAQVGLIGKGGQKYSSYSTGMKQRLYFAYAIMANPEILVLDEPFNGLDPLGVQRLSKIIADFSKKGSLVLISSHSIRDLQAMLDAALFMDQGRIIETLESVSSVDLFQRYIDLIGRDGGGLR